MPRIIKDEFTNRTDLSRHQKHRLRKGVENYRIEHASSQRVWRDKNPDSWEATQERHRAKKKLERVQKRLSNAKISITKNNRVSLGIRSQILHHHAKGRSVADIIIWTNQPASVVQSVIQSATQALATP